MKQYQEAIEKFKEAIKQQPENIDIWCSWGVALVELQQYQEAVEKFEKALEVKPDFVPALYGCGYARAHQRLQLRRGAACRRRRSRGRPWLS